MLDRFAGAVAERVTERLIHYTLAATGMDYLDKIVTLNAQRGGNPNYTTLAEAYLAMLRTNFPARVEQVEREKDREWARLVIAAYGDEITPPHPVALQARKELIERALKV